MVLYCCVSSAYDQKFSHFYFKTRKRVARPVCANADVHFLPTDWLCYCHLANNVYKPAHSVI